MTDAQKPEITSLEPIQPQAERGPKIGNYLRRFALFSAIASVAVTAFNNSTDTSLPWSLRVDADDPHIERVSVPGRQEIVPGKIVESVTAGPDADISVPQEYAKDFKALPLNSDLVDEVNNYINKIKEIISDPKVDKVEITIESLASDESRVDSVLDDANLGKPSKNNQSLAMQRGKLVNKLVSGNFADEPRVFIKLSGTEQLLSPDQIQKVEGISLKYNLSLEELMQSYNNGSLELSSQESDLMKHLFEDNRGARLTSTITRRTLPITLEPCDVVQQVIDHPGTTAERQNPGDNGMIITFLPIPPVYLPKRKKKYTEPDDGTNLDSTSPKNLTQKTGLELMTGKSQESSVNKGGFFASWAKQRAINKDLDNRRVIRGERTNSYYKALDRRQLVGRRIRRVALLGLVSLVPFVPSCSSEKAITPADKISACREITYQAGRKDSNYLSAPWTIANNLFNQRRWTSGRIKILGDIPIIDTTRTTRIPAHRVINVDSSGKIQSIIKVDEQTTKDQLTPVFSK